MTQTILFLCPHSAAKSVLAAVYFQQLAEQSGLDVTASFAGTEPDETISPQVATLLQSEGFDLSSYSPQRVTPEALVQAGRIISLGCEVSHLAPAGLPLEQWNDIPPPSQNLAAARELILARVTRLVEELKASA